MKPIRYVLDHLDEWKLIWYGSRGRLVWIKIFAHCLVFVIFQRFFLIFSPIANAIYDFFLGWRILCFHSLIKSTLFAGKELLCLDNKQNNTWWLVNSRVQLDVSRVSAVSSALTREISSWTLWVSSKYPSLGRRHFHIWTFQYWRVSLAFVFNLLARCI